jgi:hypothetical protein
MERAITFRRWIALEFPASPASEASPRASPPQETQKRNEKPEMEDSEEPEEGKKKEKSRSIRNPIPLPDRTSCKISGSTLDAIIPSTRRPRTIDTEAVDLLLYTGNGLPFRQFRR